MLGFFRNQKTLQLREYVSNFRKFCDKKIRSMLEESFIMREKLKDLTKTNYELGLLHMRRGNLYDAALRFRITLWITPDFALAHYNIGRVFLMQGKIAKAVDAFMAARRFQPHFPEVDYMLAFVKHNKAAITMIPRSIIEDYFDDLAPRYNEEYIQHLHYVGHHALVDAICDTVENKALALDILDLGCGTGLCGSVIKERIAINSLTGVDVSEKMLREARKITHNGKPAYEYLKHQDMLIFLQKNDRKYDLIMGALSFSYVGQLDALLLACKNALRPGGILAFSTEESPSHDIMVNETMQNFCHSLDYISEQAHLIGFKEISLKKTVLQENAMAIQCVLKNS